MVCKLIEVFVKRIYFNFVLLFKLKIYNADV